MNSPQGRFFAIVHRSRETRWALGSQIVTSGGTFLTTIVLVQGVGIELFGVFSACYLLTMIARSFLAGIVLTPMSTVGPKLQPVALPAYRGFLAVNAIIFAVGSSLAILLLATPLANLLNAPWLPDLAWPTATASFTANLADFIRRYHFVYEAPIRAFVADAARYAAQTVGLLVLTMGAIVPLTPATALVTLSVAACVGSVIGASGAVSIVFHRRLWSAVWQKHRSFVQWMTPSVALDALQNAGLFLIGSTLLGESALGIARAMQNLANVINVPVNALAQIMPSKAARTFKLHGPTRARTYLTQSSLAMLLLLLSLSTIIFLVRDPLIYGLFHLDPSDGLAALLLFITANLFAAMKAPVVVELHIHGRVQSVLASSATAVIVGLLSLLAFAGALDGEAIACARLLAVVASLVVAYLLCQRDRQLRLITTESQLADGQ